METENSLKEIIFRKGYAVSVELSQIPSSKRVCGSWGAVISIVTNAGLLDEFNEYRDLCFRKTPCSVKPTRYDYLREIVFKEANSVIAKLNHDTSNKKLHGAWKILTEIMDEAYLLDLDDDLRCL